MHPLLQPVVELEPRPAPSDSPEEWQYTRSYLLLRALVGVVGVLLPLVLIFLDTRVFQDLPDTRGSLSAYYYSGARDVFVGALVLVAAFLLTYRFFELNLDNVLSILAGLAALFIAFFPTGVPSDDTVLTSLQRTFSEESVERIHYIAAALFILSLGAIALTFGLRAGRDPRESEMKRSPRFWRKYHFVCAAAILVAVAFIVFSKLVWGPPNYLLYGEWLAAWAFGASWFMSGFELKTLRGPST